MRKYRELARITDVRTVMVLGMVIRIPMFAQGLILTLHILNDLGRDYAAAGLVGGVFTVAAGLAQPWRGRLIDRRGIRRTLLPSLIVLPLAWGVAPFVGYWWLLGVAAVAGLFQPPSFAVIRSVIIAATGPKLRRAGLTADSIAVEIAFAIGPILAVLAVQAWTATWALLVFSVAAIAANGALYVANPQTVHVDDSGEAVFEPRTRWLTLPVMAVLAIMASAVFILAGTDLSLVAALQGWNQSASLGWVFALWSVGSIAGGLVFGASTRPIPSALLLGGLALVTAPAVFATNDVTMGLLMIVAGTLCAPAIAATTDELSRLVPAGRRGEAMGWHGAFGTIGQGLGAPVAGWVIDMSNWQTGFLATAALGLALAVVCGLVTRRSSRTTGA